MVKFENLRVALRKILPKELEHVFFSDDGSTAVEVALKMAVQYWKNAGRPEKRSLVALEHAYHGDTVKCLTVLSSKVYRLCLFSVSCFKFYSALIVE